MGAQEGRLEKEVFEGLENVKEALARLFEAKKRKSDVIFSKSEAQRYLQLVDDINLSLSSYYARFFIQKVKEVISSWGLEESYGPEILHSSREGKVVKICYVLKKRDSCLNFCLGLHHENLKRAIKYNILPSVASHESLKDIYQGSPDQKWVQAFLKYWDKGNKILSVEPHGDHAVVVVSELFRERGPFFLASIKSALSYGRVVINIIPKTP